MVASVVSERDSKPQEIEFPKPDPLPDGGLPEERIVLCGISWESYLNFDKALGDNRPGPRFYYLDGELEIMTTSREHERIKEWLGALLEIYFEEGRHCDNGAWPGNDAKRAGSGGGGAG